ncbi:hypothetical protein A1OO_21235 [Enterovibrio norvegicus FF-33]|uniref:DUF2069 domain-containing protein n=1 Tax=Enterovibrio norvegicus FF-454 TaxID=1185651 RepID=A0A1E5C620_9GAMM|nr:DUF2069 domain-containing protein [Enterovibrio norvegicus]OEE60950.1 hypothetical protein A1OK_21305 [Enterovibrio norvegicus FF-454]OEE68252.1 hypothetical protein A1OO_21235 [Enterovibrio norvegicus FF-33]OEE74034.1 hypothetical protein A1OQ_10125 [Enterovibrio norvegicus FF-162]
MFSSTSRLRATALSSYLGLFVWVALWHGVLSPHVHVNPYGVTIAWLLPLLLPLKGILTGKPYTHAWANFILMFYFIHALTILWVDQGERWLALVELLLTSISFVSNIYFAKRKGQELGLGLKKLSQVEREEKARFEK